jgi:Galactose oxidase, central domain
MSNTARRSLFLLLVLLALPTVHSHAQSFVRTGNMMMPRLGHSATLLQDGRVLVAGGYNPIDGFERPPLNRAPHATSAAEIYNPATGTFSETGAMTAERARHVAVLLQDGRVLLVGGDFWQCGFCIPTADFYDPVTGAFTSTGHMSVAQWVDSAILLKNGKVLVSGTSTTEVFDPATGAFTPVNAPLNSYDYGVTMSLLSDGEVLMVSRSGLSLYDPGSDGFRQLPIGWHIEGTTATPLLDGSVVLAGGYTDDYGFDASPHTYVYDPATQTLKSTADMSLPRDSHTATLLRDGRVLIAGGYNSPNGPIGPDTPDGIFSTAELYDPATGKLVRAGDMVWGRDGHAATLLRDGRVLITGGRATAPGNTFNFANPDDSTAELYIPDSTKGSVPRVEFNSTRYCVGDSWILRAESIAPLASVQISGTRDGSPWTISNWQTSEPDGTLVATGTYAADAVGHYTLWLYAGGKTSSSISVTIESCSVQRNSAQ